MNQIKIGSLKEINEKSTFSKTLKAEIKLPTENEIKIHPNYNIIPIEKETEKEIIKEKEKEIIKEKGEDEKSKKTISSK